MKKLIIAILLFIPCISFAYTAQEKATLIAWIWSRIAELQQELIIAIQQEQQLPIIGGNPIQKPVIVNNQVCIPNPVIDLHYKIYSEYKQDLYIATSTAIQVYGNYSTGCALDKNTPYIFTPWTSDTQGMPWYVDKRTLSTPWSINFLDIDNSGTETKYSTHFQSQILNNYPMGNTATLTIGETTQSITIK